MTNPHFLSFSATGMSVWLFEFQWLLAGVLCPPRFASWETCRPWVPSSLVIGSRGATQLHQSSGQKRCGNTSLHWVFWRWATDCSSIIKYTNDNHCNDDNGDCRRHHHHHHFSAWLSFFFGTLGKGSTDLQRLSSNIMFSKLQAKPTSQTQWMFKYNLAW